MAEKDFYDIKGLGELPDEQTATHPAAPYRPMKTSRKSGHMVRNLLIVLAVVVVLAAGGGGAYWYMKHHKSSNVSKSSSSTTTVATAPSSTATTSSSSGQYISNGSDLNLSFSYPANWTVSPASGGNSNDKTITVTSPVVSIPDANGATTNGKIVVTLRPSSAGLSELNTGSPVAAQDSVQIAYSAPTSSQHQYTYLTFVHFTNGETAAGAFEEVLVTGIQQFTKGGSVSAAELSGLDPIIGANFYRCSDTTCAGTGAGSLSINNATWQNNAFVQQITTLFESLKLN
jgi:hypothetical protein